MNQISPLRIKKGREKIRKDLLLISNIQKYLKVTEPISIFEYDFLAYKFELKTTNVKVYEYDEFLFNLSEIFNMIKSYKDNEKKMKAQTKNILKMLNFYGCIQKHDYWIIEPAKYQLDSLSNECEIFFVTENCLNFILTKLIREINCDLNVLKKFYKYEELNDLKESTCTKWLKLSDLYRDVWNEIIIFLDNAKDFFNITRISKSIRTEILYKNIGIKTENVTFTLKSGDDLRAKILSGKELFFLKKIIVKSDFKGRFLPDSIKSLSMILTYSVIKYYPKSLKSLKVFGNKYFKGKKLPNTLKILNVCSCRAFKGDDLPNSIETLVVSRWCTSFTGESLPNSIKYLGIFKVNSFEGKSLPNSIKILSCKDCENFLGENLPESVETLAVNDCKIFSPIKLSKSNIKTLLIKWNKFKGDHIPKTIKRIIISNCSVFIGDQLPDSIVYLSIDYADSFIGDKLPENIKILKISRCLKFKGDKLSKLSKLTNLTINRCYDFSGENLPNCIEIISIYGCKKFKADIVKLTNKNVKIQYSRTHFLNEWRIIPKKLLFEKK